MVGRWQQAGRWRSRAVACCVLLLMTDCQRQHGTTHAAKQGPKPAPKPLGGWRCCWGGTSCAEANAARCPALPTPSYCDTYAGCLGPCSSPTNRTRWCEMAPACAPDDDKKHCETPPSTFDDPALRQRARPPRQTPMQAAAMAKIEEKAQKLSAAARPWVLQYMKDIRPSLNTSLQVLLPETLLEMFEWEFQRLPIFHNAPLDDWDVDRIGINDDTPLNITLTNGHIHNPCQRWVLGGPEDLFTTVMYGDMFSVHFDMKVQHLCDLTASLRGSNNCLLFNANNLLHGSIGNYEYGGMTYVLDSKRLQGRMFVEPIDGGLMTMLEWRNWRFWVNLLFGNLGWNTWVLGTIYPPAFYHLLQPHEAENKVMNDAYNNLAPILNYWWVEGAPFPTQANSGGVFLTYFEVMTSNIWLPEDILAGIAKFASEGGDHGTPGLWGTELGQQLRRWCARHGRPLIWADRQDGPMLLDPLVASQLHGFSHRTRVARGEIEAFELAWEAHAAWKEGAFDALAALTPKYLHFHWQTWRMKSACFAQEQNVSLHVMGYNGLGECVFWTQPPDTVRAGWGWECLNDGTCAQTLSARAVFQSEVECTGRCGSAWTCTQRNDRHVSHSSAYCLPAACNETQTVTTSPGAHYASADACEAVCKPDDSARNMLCHDWVTIIVTTLWSIVIAHCVGVYVVARRVLPRQQFKTALPTRCRRCKCKAAGAQAATVECRGCLLSCCCPCFQWLRVLAFICECPRTTCGNVCCGCGCMVFALCVVLNPIGLAIWSIGNCCCGAFKNALTRCQIRQRLKIKGAFWEDYMIHCSLLSMCAWCQEAGEISAAGYSGVVYQHHEPDGRPVLPIAPVLAIQPATADVHAQAPQSEEMNDRRQATRRPLLQQPLLGHLATSLLETDNAANDRADAMVNAPQPATS
jgi:hypothetical protein